MQISPAADPRRARLWIGLATALLILFTMGLCWRAGPGSWSLFDTSSKTTITHDLVVEKVQAVAKLVSSETTVRDVVVYENRWMNSTKRSLVVVTGKVSAGVDLAEGSEVRIDSVARHITVSLPPAKVLGVEILSLRTYDERAGL